LFKDENTLGVTDISYSDTSKISNKVVALAINKNFDLNNVDFVIEYQYGASPLSALVIVAIVAAVCLFFCCCVCCSGATYGGRRYYYHTHGYHNVSYYDSGTHSGYGGGGNSYSGSYSDGGNSYSGSYSNSGSGGNSYSGGGSGGNSYS
jgi:hypothetical protein